MCVIVCVCTIIVYIDAIVFLGEKGRRDRSNGGRDLKRSEIK